MEHGPVDPIMMLADVFDKQLDAVEVGLEDGAKHACEHGEIEGHRRPFKLPFDCGWIAPNEPIKCSASCGFATVAQDILRHRTPDDIEARLVECAENKAG